MYNIIYELVALSECLLGDPGRLMDVQYESYYAYYYSS